MTKSKICAPGAKVAIRVAFDSMGYDRGLELFQQGVAFGLIEKSGTWYSYGQRKAQGGPGFSELINSDLIFARELEDDVRACW